jgi:hypothetical protein
MLDTLTKCLPPDDPRIGCFTLRRDLCTPAALYEYATTISTTTAFDSIGTGQDGQLMLSPTCGSWLFTLVGSKPPIGTQGVVMDVDWEVRKQVEVVARHENRNENGSSANSKTEKRKGKERELRPFMMNQVVQIPMIFKNKRDTPPKQIIYSTFLELFARITQATDISEDKFTCEMSVMNGDWCNLDDARPYLELSQICATLANRTIVNVETSYSRRVRYDFYLKSRDVEIELTVYYYTVIFC